MIETVEDPENKETNKDDIDEVGEFSSIETIRNSQEPVEGRDCLLLKLILLLHIKNFSQFPMIPSRNPISSQESSSPGIQPLLLEE